MKQLGSWIGGFLIGVFISLAWYVLQQLRSTLREDDPSQDIVSVSWGTPRGNTNLWVYQIRVLARDSNSDGLLEVSAHCGIGSSTYRRDFGSLGNATDIGDAVRKYGTVTWGEEALTIGGDGGPAFTIDRSTLEQHR
jgi:hypothetical protein